MRLPIHTHRFNFFLAQPTQHTLARAGRQEFEPTIALLRVPYQSIFEAAERAFTLDGSLQGPLRPLIGNRIDKVCHVLVTFPCANLRNLEQAAAFCPLDSSGSVHPLLFPIGNLGGADRFTGRFGSLSLLRTRKLFELLTGIVGDRRNFTSFELTFPGGLLRLHALLPPICLRVVL